MYITVGPWFGGGLSVDGQLHRGAGLVSGEVGHQAIDVNGPDCYCGAKGCWEMFAAGPAIARQAAERATANGLLLTLSENDRSKITTLMVARAAEQGDAFAIELFDQTAFYLGVGLANLLHIITPEVAIMGGGMMGSWSLLGPKII